MIEIVSLLFYNFILILISETSNTTNSASHLGNITGVIVESGRTTTMESQAMDELIIVSRAEWGAREPKDIQQLSHPVPKVIIHHSMMKANDADTLEKEFELVKKIQDFHMDDDVRKWSDIGYSFLIGQSGTIFEGRGWSRIGAHSLGNNSVSVGICLLGDFTAKLPTPPQIESAKNLISYGVREGFISEEHLLFGHRDVRKGTECPGTAFYNELLSNWPHKSVAKPDEIF